jgi:hypothetical protein
MVYGINVSGQLADPPLGELDLWVRPDKLAEESGVSEEAIKDQLSKNFKPFDAGRMDFVIRLKTTKDAEFLVTLLRQLAAEQTKKSLTAVA